MSARNTLVQLLALYIDPTDSVADRQTDRRTHDDANSGSYCVAVQSANNDIRSCWNTQ